MTLQPYEQVLIDGGRRELLDFGSCKYCVVVDWRDDVETILGDVKRMLPKDYSEYRRINEQKWELRCDGNWRTLEASDGGDTEPVLRSINVALSPEFEMRIFTPTMGDGYSLLLLPAKWWSEFSTQYGARSRDLFVTTAERVAFTGTDPSLQKQPKSWWRKLLGT